MFVDIFCGCYQLEEGSFYSHFSDGFIFKIFFNVLFGEHFNVHCKIERMTQRSHLYCLDPHMPYQCPTKVLCLLQFTNVQWHIIITTSPYYTLRLILGVLPSMDLRKCIIICTNHYSNSANYFNDPKLHLHSTFPILYCTPTTHTTTDLFHCL